MRKICSMAKRNLLTVNLIVLCSTTFGQVLFPPKIQSPNAASLGNFGEVPVNLFTGTPDISVPIYNLKYGNISVPINLRYSAAAVKPGQAPGWVGSGWDLESYGMITRQKRGVLDEYYNTNDMQAGADNYFTYYPFPSNSTKANANFGSYYANMSTWYNTTQLKNDFVNYSNMCSCQGIDVQADEFTFNVMGHSGKFYYEGANGWKVASDENIKIDMTDFFSPIEITYGMQDHLQIYQPCNPISLAVSNYQSRMFGSFTLTMPDGTKYIFGGRKPSTISGYTGTIPDAVEYNSPRNPTNSATFDLTFEIDTWLLKSIIDANGNEIDFSYVNSYPTCNNFYVSNSSGGIAYVGSCSGSFGSSVPFNQNIQYETLQWPMYLSQINSPNEFVNFSISDVNSDVYSLTQLNYQDQGNQNSNTQFEGSLLGSICNGDPNVYLKNLRWEKLDQIKITDNMHNSDGLNNYQPNIIKQYKFVYNNTPSQRLMLNNLQLLDKQSNLIGQYQFAYNSDLVTKSPNLHADGNYSDHWGFYNGTSFPAYPNSVDFQIYKQSSAANVTSELLNKITYPTGGSTKLMWEANDYSQVVNINRQSLAPYTNFTSLNGYGGGSRIFETQDVLADGSIQSDKKYYYKNNYSNGVQLSSLSSSGVLNGVPIYHIAVNPTLGALGNLTIGGSTDFMYSVGNYGYTGQGSPVGYKEVSILNADGTYTKNYFTNYDADVNGVTHWDQAPLGTLGWSDQYNYYQRASLEPERGKVTKSVSYKADNTPVQSTVITYRNDAGRFNSYVNLIEKPTELNVSIQCSQGPPVQDALIFSVARQVFTYSSYPIGKAVTTYDQNGANPVTIMENLTQYNSNNLLQVKNIVNSKGETVTTTYTYPTDHPTTSPYNDMINAHVLNPVISTALTTVLLGSGTSSPISTITKNYSEPYTNIFVPQNLQIEVGSNSIETREQVNNFDSKGHPREVQKPNGPKEVYLWGCNSQYILAKIIGSDYLTASGFVSQSILDQAGVGYNNYTDSYMRNYLNNLRMNLPNAQVTTYTYACGVGITSETDPSGRTTYYDYDMFNRLIDIRDQDNNIVKRFCYNYAGQPDNCANVGYGNTVKTGAFTSTNSCPSGTSPATVSYTIPANTYYAADQPTADAMATAALNSQGQALANSTPCQAAISGTNTTGIPWNGSMTNTSSNANYSFSIYPNYNNTPLVTVPVGAYNISLTPTPAQSSALNLTINGVTYSGTSFSLANITINTATNLNFSNPTGSGPCSVVMSSGFTSPTNGLSSNGTAVSGYLVFYSSSTMSAGNSYQIGTISGTCRPSVTRTFTTTSIGRTWTVTVAQSGTISVQMAYGSSSVSAGTTVNLTISYNL